MDLETDLYFVNKGIKFACVYQTFQRMLKVFHLLSLAPSCVVYNQVRSRALKLYLLLTTEIRVLGGHVTV